MNQPNLQSQFLEAITELGSTKKLSTNEILLILSDSIKKAFTRDDPDINLDVQIDLSLGILKINRVLKVIESETEDFDDMNEITLEDAKKVNPNIKIGDTFYKEISLLSKNDISNQMVRYILQLFKQRIAELTNKSIVNEWIDRVGTLIYAEVEKEDAGGSYIINLEKTSGFLQRSETIKGEKLQLGSKYWFVIKAVKEQSRGWPILLSRADEKLLEYLLISNVPELENKTIEIKKIARAAGQKAKVAVISNKAGFDPIAAIVGMNGEKIKMIASQLHNELIDIFLWNENYQQLIVNAISPVKVLGINVVEDSEREKSMEIFVDDEYLPNVIGRSGVNIKLLAKLTGWNIDVKSVSQAKEEEIEITPTTYVAEGTPGSLNYNSKNKFNNSFSNKYQKRNNSLSNRFVSKSNKYLNYSSNQHSLENLMSYSTKSNEADEIIVDDENIETNESSKKKINSRNIKDLTKKRNDNYSITKKHIEINEKVENELNSSSITSNNEEENHSTINEQVEMQNLIENIDLNKEPKRQMKEVKLPTQAKDKSNVPNKRKNKRTIIDDFSLLDSDYKEIDEKDIILIDEDDE